jgi:hypothetical protein
VRIWRLNPVSKTIATCTTKNKTSATNAKKWIVRADCEPPNKSSKAGYAAVMAGDMVSPLRTMSGNVTTTTPK